MPRTAEVSGRVEVRWSLFSPSPTSVWRCLASRRIGEPICRTVTVLVSAIIRLLSGFRAGAVAVGDAAARLQRRHLEAAARRDRAWAILVLQRVEGRAHEVVGVRRAERLRDDVLHAKRLEDGAGRAAGDDAGALRRGAQDHLAGAPASVHIVMEGAALAQRDPDYRALGRIRRLADRLRHLTGLAVTEADAALLVADDDERREAEAPAALHHLGDAVDVDEAVDEFAVARLVAVILAAAASCFSCHVTVSLARAAEPARLNGFFSPADPRNRGP